MNLIIEDHISRSESNAEGFFLQNSHLHFIVGNIVNVMTPTLQKYFQDVSENKI